MVKKSYTVDNLNPRSQPVKQLEMTVVRALELIKQFDAAPGGDPLNIESKQWKKVFGPGWYNQPEVKNLVELAERYESLSLHRQVLDLYQNLPPAVQKRKEIRDGIRRINKVLDS